MCKTSSARRTNIVAMENWKAVPGWEGIYEASDLGRVRRLWANGHTRILKPWIVRASKKDGGKPCYPRCQLSRVDEATGEKIKVRHNVHRLVWVTFRGAIPDGLEINHKDLNKANAALRNLELRTPAGNRQHYHANKPPRVALETQGELRKLAPTITRAELARRFKLTIETVRSIVGDIPSPGGRKLTPEDCAAIRMQMKARQKPDLKKQAIDIATAWGISLPRVHQIARAEEGARHHPNPGRWKLILDDAAQRGLTAPQVAAERGVHRNRVYQASTYWRVPLKPVAPASMGMAA